MVSYFMAYTALDVLSSFSAPPPASIDSLYVLSLLDNCKTLKRLTLHYVLQAQYDKEDRSYRPLEHLSIQCFPENLNKILPWVQLRSLRSLRVTFDRQSEFGHSLPQLLATCQSTLRNLDLDIKSCCMFTSIEFHFSKLTIHTSPQFVQNLSRVRSRRRMSGRHPSISIHTCWPFSYRTTYNPNDLRSVAPADCNVQLGSPFSHSGYYRPHLDCVTQPETDLSRLHVVAPN